MNKLKLLTILIYIILISSCEDDCVSGYVFDIPLNITPSDSILHVGDTLHVLMKTDNQAIKDTSGDRTVQFPNFDPNAFFNLPIIDTFPVKEGFILNRILVDTSLFDIVIGNTEHLGIGLFFLGIPNDEYESIIEFRVVLRTAGTYALICRNALFFTDYHKHIKFPNRCKTGDLLVMFNFSQGNHQSILNEKHQKVLDKYWEKSSGDFEFSDKYYFKVVE